MRINGNTLPGDFLQALDSGVFSRQRGSWQLKADVDFRGNKLETELGKFYNTRRQIEIRTDKLSSEFLPYVDVSNESIGPGGIPDIECFDQIVAFAICGGGSPFCLDFRNDALNPQVIWWDDVYWRNLAPSFSEFVLLFDLTQ